MLTPGSGRRNGPVGVGDHLVIPNQRLAVVAAVVGSGWSVVWLQLLKWPPFLDSIVKATLLSVALCQVTFGLWLLTIKNGFGLLVILGAGFTAMLITIMQAWIPFTTGQCRPVPVGVGRQVRREAEKIDELFGSF